MPDTRTEISVFCESDHLCYIYSTMVPPVGSLFWYEETLTPSSKATKYRVVRVDFFFFKPTGTYRAEVHVVREPCE
jgi:hypothetical protein